MRLFPSRKTRPMSSTRPRSHSGRPALEILEDRCCPSSTSYTVTDLGLSPTSVSSTTLLHNDVNFRLGINNAIQVVGQAGTGNPSVAANHAFFWQNGVFADLGTLGGPTSRALAINNAAFPQIVGWADTAASDGSGNSIYHAALWQQDGSGGWTITDLGTLPGTPNSAATAINNLGQVVGGQTKDINNGSGGFLWQNGLMTDLYALLPANSGWSIFTPQGINNGGQITTGGLYQNSNPDYALRLDPSTTNPGTYTITRLTNLNAVTLGDTFNRDTGYALNSSGQVVGSSLEYAALWKTTSPTNLNSGSTNKRIGSAAFGINNATQVVGGQRVFGSSTYAFLLQGGKAINLNSLIPRNSGWNLIEADSINDATTSLPSGSIVGYGIYNGQTHMFLAIDPPTPAGPALPGSSGSVVPPTAEGPPRDVMRTSLLVAPGGLTFVPTPSGDGSAFSTPRIVAASALIPTTSATPPALRVQMMSGGGGEDAADQALIDWQPDVLDAPLVTEA